MGLSGSILEPAVSVSITQADQFFVARSRDARGLLTAKNLGVAEKRECLVMLRRMSVSR